MSTHPVVCPRRLSFSKFDESYKLWNRTKWSSIQTFFKHKDFCQSCRLMLTLPKTCISFECVMEHTISNLMSFLLCKCFCTLYNLGVDVYVQSCLQVQVYVYYCVNFSVLSSFVFIFLYYRDYIMFTCLCGYSHISVRERNMWIVRADYTEPCQ